MSSAIRTTHGLTFEVSDHFKVLGMDDGYGWMGFRIGTCEGLWTQKVGAYRILAIQNKEPHNGHLEDVFEYFEHACRRDKMPMVVHEVNNPALARILLRRGFLPIFGTKEFKWDWNTKKAQSPT